ncbi:MAG TPA: hypothetical protein VFE62_03580 [Gemmataceae bacterium]|nr:hypothetical protein [Gemmataceae bacterium]
MQARLASIRQHIQEAQRYAKELADLCGQTGNSDYIYRADDIELALGWTDRKAADFQAVIPSSQP